MSDDDGWSPYGLEAYRQSHLWRRRLAVVAVALVVAVAYVAVLQFGTDTDTVISTIGRGDGDTLTFEQPESGPPEPDATITLEPGELTVPDQSIQTDIEEPGDAPVAPSGQPGVEPIDWTGVLLRWGIPLALILVGFLVGRVWGRASESERVNYGVYKGALPMETISARYNHLVETTRATYEHPFGKRRSHYVPDGDAGGEAGNGADRR